ncbi:hypothetical protein GA0115240_10661, partial [Streptomyces sp. DvalAA-14]|uniref:DUF6199 family natural product biosynthesis protein n=1 Tax=unclassified Streptomyces TaxID=2593676 RepID=UPI00081B2A4E
MTQNPALQMASGLSEGNPFVILFLCVFLAVGLLQVVRPQLLWRFNRRLQTGWVRDPDGTEPTGRGYAAQRVTG